jgi:hypothetical protein
MPPVSIRLMYPASVSSLPILLSSSCCVRPLAFRNSANLSRNNSPAFKLMRNKQYEERAQGHRSVNVELLLSISTFHVDLWGESTAVPGVRRNIRKRRVQIQDQKYSDSSICLANCERDSFSNLHNRTIVLKVGLSSPRSIKLMVVRSNPVSKASCSCESPIFFRLARRIFPKALSGPERG